MSRDEVSGYLCPVCGQALWECDPLEEVPGFTLGDPDAGEGPFADALCAEHQRDRMKVENMQVQTHYLMHIATSLAHLDSKK